jgi:hypothetical protein
MLGSAWMRPRLIFIAGCRYNLVRDRLSRQLAVARDGHRQVPNERDRIVVLNPGQVSPHGIRCLLS